MNIKKYIYVIIFLLSLSSSFVRAEEKGSVCLGPFLSVVWYEPSERPYLTINDSRPFRFEQGTGLKRLIIDDLDLNIIHKVKIHFHGKITNSWNLDFKNFQTNMVLIWRSKSAWRMEPITNGQCE